MLIPIMIFINLLSMALNLWVGGDDMNLFIAGVNLGVAIIMSIDYGVERI